MRVRKLTFVCWLWEGLGGGRKNRVHQMTTLSQGSLCASHASKCFTRVSSHSVLTPNTPHPAAVYTPGNCRGRENLGHVPKVTQLRSDEARIRIRALVGIRCHFRCSSYQWKAVGSAGLRNVGRAQRWRVEVIRLFSKEV